MTVSSIEEAAGSVEICNKLNEVIAAFNELKTKIKRNTIIHDRNYLLEQAIMMLSKDMHSASSRPCSTCQVVSNALGKDFGCVAFAKARLKEHQK